MKYRLYTSSAMAWEGMFKAIEKAQKSIYLEMYILAADTKLTHDFFSLLENKARLGLEIVIVADAFGSLDLPKENIERLRTAGVEFIFFSHWLRRTHRKILIIDERTAFTGGVNIGEKYRNWRDMHIKIEGPIIKPLLKSFAYAYEMAGGKKENLVNYSHRRFTRKIKSWVIDNLADTSRAYYLNDYYKERIIAAQKSIKIVTPYLLPPRWFVALLDGACRRGVKVEILIPNNTDIKLINKVNYLNACRLSEIGIQFFCSPVMNHAKIIMLDDEEGVIGSQNMDVLSFNWNIEAGVFFRQKKLVTDLLKIIDQWKTGSVEFNASQRPWRFSDKILIAILKLFYPIF